MYYTRIIIIISFLSHAWASDIFTSISPFSSKNLTPPRTKLTKMDVKKLNIPTLDGPNWGIYIIHLQAALCILDCYNVVRGKLLTPPPNPTYDLFIKPTQSPACTTAADVAICNMAKAVWNKQNTQALSIMQAMVPPVIWQDYLQYGGYMFQRWTSSFFIDCHQTAWKHVPNNE